MLSIPSSEFMTVHAALLKHGFLISHEPEETLDQTTADQLLLGAQGESIDPDSHLHPNYRKKNYEAYNQLGHNPNKLVAFIKEHPECTHDLLEICANDAAKDNDLALIFIYIASKNNLISQHKWRILYINIADFACSQIAFSASQNVYLSYGPGWRLPDEPTNLPKAFVLFEKIRPEGFSPSEHIFLPTNLKHDRLSRYRHLRGLSYFHAVKEIIKEGARANLIDEDKYGFCAKALNLLEDAGLEEFKKSIGYNTNPEIWKQKSDTWPYLHYTFEQIFQSNKSTAVDRIQALNHLIKVGAITLPTLQSQFFLYLKHTPCPSALFTIFLVSKLLLESPQRHTTIHKLQGIAKYHPDQATSAIAAICYLRCHTDIANISQRVQQLISKLPMHAPVYWNELAKVENHLELAPILPALCFICPKNIPSLLAASDEQSQGKLTHPLVELCSSIISLSTTETRQEIIFECLKKENQKSCLKLAQKLLKLSKQPVKDINQSLKKINSTKNHYKIILAALQNPDQSIDLSDILTILTHTKCAQAHEKFQKQALQLINNSFLTNENFSIALPFAAQFPILINPLIEKILLDSSTPEKILLIAKYCNDDINLKILNKKIAIPIETQQIILRRYALRALNQSLDYLLSKFTIQLDDAGNTLSHYAIAGDNWKGAILCEKFSPGSLRQKNSHGISPIDCAISKGGKLAEMAKAWAKTQYQALDILGEAEGVHAANILLSEASWIQNWNKEIKSQFAINRALACTLEIIIEKFNSTRNSSWNPIAKQLIEDGIALLKDGKITAGCNSILNASHIAQNEASNITSSAKKCSQTIFIWSTEEYSIAAQKLRERQFSHETLECIYICKKMAEQLLSITKTAPSLADIETHQIIKKILFEEETDDAKKNTENIEIEEQIETKISLAIHYAAMGEIELAEQILSEINGIKIIPTTKPTIRKILNSVAQDSTHGNFKVAEENIRALLLPSPNTKTNAEKTKLNFYRQLKNLCHTPGDQHLEDILISINQLPKEFITTENKDRLFYVIDRIASLNKITHPQPKGAPHNSNSDLVAKISLLCAKASIAAYEDQLSAWNDLIESGVAFPFNSTTATLPREHSHSLDIPPYGIAQKNPYTFQHGLWKCGIGRALAFETKIDGRKTYILAIRGTQPNKGMKIAEFTPLIVQAYLPIWHHAEAIKPLALAMEKKAIEENAKFIITGHSLGGSCAETLCNELPYTTCAITFGSPGSGKWDPIFGWRFKIFGPQNISSSRILSFLHPLDPIPKIGNLLYVKTAKYRILTGPGSHRKKQRNIIKKTKENIKITIEQSKLLNISKIQAISGICLAAHKSTIYQNAINSAKNLLATHSLATKLTKQLQNI